MIFGHITTGLQAGIGFGYFTGPVGNYFFTGSDSVNEINFPLIGFVVTVIINLFSILYSETQRRKPQVKLKEESDRAN